MIENSVNIYTLNILVADFHKVLPVGGLTPQNVVFIKI